MIKQILGFILVLTGVLDAIKYIWTINAIKKAKTSKSHSRKFLNAAILSDFVKILYSICIGDIFIFISGVLALITMCYNYYITYLYYPYRCRGLDHFKRPSLIIYIINSFLPNQIRKRL